MAQEDKNLLLTDLCARLPYGVKCLVPTENLAMELTGKRLNYFCFHKEEWGTNYCHELEVVLDPLNDFHNQYIIKPYLRPMPSMTKKEKDVYYDYIYDAQTDLERAALLIDWLNAHHFDYRGLIEKGLALEAPEGMYS